MNEINSLVLKHWKDVSSQVKSLTSHIKKAKVGYFLNSKTKHYRINLKFWNYHNQPPTEDKLEEWAFNIACEIEDAFDKFGKKCNGEEKKIFLVYNNENCSYLNFQQGYDIKTDNKVYQASFIVEVE